MSETSEPKPSERRRVPVWGLVLAIVLSAAITFAVFALLTTIFEHKQEAKNPYMRLVEVDNNTTDPQRWGINWPREYDGYQRTSETTHTRYGGSDGLPKSRLDESPWLKRMFSGYAFAIDFNTRRGHAYMLFDQEQTKRITEKPQPGACLNCHSSVVPTYRRIGLEKGGKTLADAQGFDWPAVFAGFEVLSTMGYVDAHAELIKTAGAVPATIPSTPTTREALAAQAGKAHPVSCVDCHDPQTMALRVTRPAFVIGIQKLAESAEPTPHLPSIQRWRDGRRRQPYDPNVDASRQEMRTFACAQCHVEYYCGPKTTMFYPWGEGLRVEQIEKYYDNFKFPDGHRFFDFKHAETGAEILKAQHPEFETWSQGIHARSGVACADCHMPYVRQGALKVSDHWVRSPLLNIARSCQTCHPFPEEEMRARVETIQHRHNALMERSGTALVAMLDEIAAAKKAGADEMQLAPILALQRQGQWRLDFINAENSMGFHAPQESARILAESIDLFRQGQVQAQQLRLTAGK
jgi:nitrite reductase (cytochrome c-552)